MCLTFLLSVPHQESVSTFCSPIISIRTRKCSGLLSPNDHSDLTHSRWRGRLNRTSVSIARKLQLLETRAGGGIRCWLCSGKVNDPPFEN